MKKLETASARWKVGQVAGVKTYATKEEATAAGKFTVRDAKTGRFIEVRGANSMPASSLPIKAGVDLTKPIAQQVLRDGSSKASKSKAH